MHETIPLACTINGDAVSCAVEPRLSLADFLRYDRGLTGTHVGCEHGVCGACTVLVDGRSVRGCLMLAPQADGCAIRTVESLGTPQALNPLQQAFARCHALQCGFCTPGILMTLTEFIESRDPALPPPQEDEIRGLLSGNLCRCTGYQGMVEAVQQLLAAATPQQQEAP